MIDDPLLHRAKALHLYGLVAHWPDIVGQPWVESLTLWEEQERQRRSLERRLLAAPDLLVIDEVGYLSYGNRHADLLFELVSRRYQAHSTLVTTNRPFAEWGEVFPNAACVVSLVDRLVHNAEVVAIEGESYRLKEAKEHSEQRAKRRRKKTEAPA